MGTDTWLGIAGCVATVGGTIWAILDARRERTQRERAVIIANSVIDRTYGLLVGLKPSLDKAQLDAVNDGLAAINAQRDGIKGL